MKDFVGIVLKESQKVVFMRGNGRYAASLQRGVISGFTPKMVRIEAPGGYSIALVEPCKIIVLSEPGK